ncbi:MAG: hypothetical protein DVB31_09505 [Verrucomicrobia bacterium]|nr:MAG: hypothetical protein DVB31_09505 [Verrucomicrobiota bacterium]
MRAGAIPSSSNAAGWIAAGILSASLSVAAADAGRSPGGPEFPAELVHFRAISEQAVFAGTGRDTWDRSIRERSYILRDGDRWQMWYNGYNDRRATTHFLGHATSRDGLHWTRSGDRPIHDKGWIEDVCVVKHAGTYHMFSEGRDDVAHWLTSTDGLHWTERGNLDIRRVDGSPIASGPRGTPYPDVKVFASKPATPAGK